MYVDIERILERISDNFRCLDLGGWDKVFPRANVVVDLNPWETRRNLYDNRDEHFTKSTWVQADFCSPSFWKTIDDKSFDFVTIGHTLEDIRDPLYVCSQMIRVAKGGYIEFPSKMRECSKANSSAHFSGYDHHRWIIEPNRDLTGLVFKAKLAWAHEGDYLGDERRHMLGDYFHQFDGIFWSGSFSFVEHFPQGMKRERDDLCWFFDNRVEDGRQRINLYDLMPDSTSLNDGACLWVDQYELPSLYERRTGDKYYSYAQYL